MKSLIGITPSIENNKYMLNRAYAEAVLKNGGIPNILTYGEIDDIDFILSKYDGILLSGGGDVDPSYYSQKIHPKTEIVDKIRDEFELTLCKKAVEKNIPLLAICRGVQILNVAFSGTLYQHIENHNFNDERFSEKHEINISPNTLLFNILKNDKIKTNSIHHQAIAKIGKDLKASAVSEDGIVEALEYNNKFTLGVQWHPEALFDKIEIHSKIFEYFIEACKNKNT